MIPRVKILPAINPARRLVRAFRLLMGLHSPRQWVRYRKAWTRALRENGTR